METASFGRGGWTAVDNLAFASDTLSRFEPDVVILLLGINDLTWHGGSSYHYSSLDSSLRVAAPRRLSTPAPSGVRRLCERLSQLCRRAAIVKRAWAARHSKLTLEWHSDNLPALRRSYRGNPFVDSPSRPNDPFVEFRDAVDSLVSYTTGSGIATIVLGQPVLWSANMSPEELNRLWIAGEYSRRTRASFGTVVTRGNGPIQQRPAGDSAAGMARRLSTSIPWLPKTRGVLLR